MKYIPSIAFEEMSGSAKGVTAAKSRGRKYIRNKGTGSHVRTAAQSSVKSIFRQLSQSWKSLTNEQIMAWTQLAQSQAGRSVLGTSSKITGANLYMRLNYWIVFCGGTALTTPPTLRGVEAPSDAEIVLNPTTFTFTLAANPTGANKADLKMVIMASAPQSNGVSNAYAKATAIGDLQTAEVDELNIKAAYDAKYGTPNDAAPKVFVKWLYVDSKTGEVSGEKMKVVKLAAAAPTT
jgi:hypothetical protein